MSDKDLPSTPQSTGEKQPSIRHSPEEYANMIEGRFADLKRILREFQDTINKHTDHVNELAKQTPSANIKHPSKILQNEFDGLTDTAFDPKATGSEKKPLAKTPGSGSY